MADWHAQGMGLLYEPTSTTAVAPSFATSTTDLAVYAPFFTAGPTGLDPYRNWDITVLDGLLYVCNGYDPPKRWDGASTFYSMGAAAPTTFSIADAAGGTAHALGVVLRYRLCFRNSSVDKETCPQRAGGADGFFKSGDFGVSHTMVANKDCKIDWTDPTGEFDKATIYRALGGSDTYNLVATVTASTETYTDAVSDTTLRTNTPHVPRLRTTLPPTFLFMFSHLNRFWGVVDGQSKVHISQRAGVFKTSELPQEDFPPVTHEVKVAPEDSYGKVTAGGPFFRQAYIWKERACYLITGDDPGTNLSVTRMYEDRGALNNRCVVGLEGLTVILDEQGLYLWTAGGEPLIAGGDPDTRESRLKPIWRRMNLGAAQTFHLFHDVGERQVMVYVALDHEPQPNVRVVYDYGQDKFVSVDVGVWGTASGYLLDSFGLRHHTRGDDLGTLSEEGIGQSEGVTVGTTTGTVTAGTALAVTCGAASFDTTINGGVGSPYTRGTSGAAHDDLNRVYAITGTVITPYYYSSDTPASGEIVLLGAIPGVAQTGKLDFGSHEQKWVREVVIEFDSGPAGTLGVWTAKDDDAFVLKTDITLTNEVRMIVPCDDRCWTWALRLTQSPQGVGFTIRKVSVRLQLLSDRRG